jgi:hypothetical protein
MYDSFHQLLDVIMFLWVPMMDCHFATHNPHLFKLLTQIVWVFYEQQEQQIGGYNIIKLSSHVAHWSTMKMTTTTIHSIVSIINIKWMNLQNTSIQKIDNKIQIC